MDSSDKEELPLEAEAEKREEWRGNVPLHGQDTQGHGEPASESDNASLGKGAPAAPRTIMPPD